MSLHTSLRYLLWSIALSIGSTIMGRFVTCNLHYDFRMFDLVRLFPLSVCLQENPWMRTEQTCTKDRYITDFFSGKFGSDLKQDRLNQKVITRWHELCFSISTCEITFPSERSHLIRSLSHLTLFTSPRDFLFRFELLVQGQTISMSYTTQRGCESKTSFVRSFVRLLTSKQETKRKKKLTELANSATRGCVWYL